MQCQNTKRPESQFAIRGILFIGAYFRRYFSHRALI